MLDSFGLNADDLILLAAAIGAFVTVYAVGQALIVRDRFAKRVKLLQQRRQQLRDAALAPKRRRRQSGPANRDWMKQLVTRLKLIQDTQAGKIQRELVNAGYRSRDAIFVYGFAQLIAPFALLGLGLIAFPIDWSNPTGGGFKLVMPFAMAYFGLKLPGIMVKNAKTKRQHTLRKSIPDTLDLMLICAEAGLSLAAALSRVSRELNTAYPLMAEEMGLTSIELGLLPDRKEALKNLVYRVDMEEIRGLVGVLLQTEKYGTPIAKALRVLSAEFRQQRMLRAEEKAARLPALMTVPMIVFILPTLFVIIMTPAVISIMDGL